MELVAEVILLKMEGPVSGGGNSFGNILDAGWFSLLMSSENSDGERHVP